ncbi:MAG: type II toxin-antitoxin system VapC family toxin [Nitrospirota bacterium]
MILIDTGPIVALFDKGDNYHKACLELLRTLKGPLITTMPVLTEAFYLLGFSWQVQEALWEFIGQEGLRIYNLNNDLFMRCRDLMKQYRDLPMDLADATLVAVAEAENSNTVFTLDQKDFKIYRTKHKKQFKLVPPKL